MANMSKFGSAGSDRRYCIKCGKHMDAKEFKTHYPNCQGKGKASKVEAPYAPGDALTKAELQAKLDEIGVEYSKTSNKTKLQELLDGAEAPDDSSDA